MKNSADAVIYVQTNFAYIEFCGQTFYLDLNDLKGSADRNINSANIVYRLYSPPRL